MIHCAMEWSAMPNITKNLPWRDRTGGTRVESGTRRKHSIATKLDNE